MPSDTLRAGREGLGVVAQTNLDGHGPHQPRARSWCYVCGESHPFHGFDKRSRQRVLEARAGGSETLEVVAAANNLAALYRLQRKFGSAEALYRGAIAILEKTQGPAHPELARVLDSYAVMLMADGRTAQGQALVSRAHAIRRAGPGSG